VITVTVIVAPLVTLTKRRGALPWTIPEPPSIGPTKKSSSTQFPMQHWKLVREHRWLLLSVIQFQTQLVCRVFLVAKEYRLPAHHCHSHYCQKYSESFSRQFGLTVSSLTNSEVSLSGNLKGPHFSYLKFASQEVCHASHLQTVTQVGVLRH
jgi:hypothetical protein